MNIENEIFKKINFDFEKIIHYGFKKEKDQYFYQKKFLNNKFEAIITIDSENKISGKVIDLVTKDEYLALRVKNNNGSFVSKVREEYYNILDDIKKCCCIINQFVFSQTNKIVTYIKQKYDGDPQFLWKDDNSAVFKNVKNKWYGIIMEIDRSKIMVGEGTIEVINVKSAPDAISKLLKISGIYPAYHMNKNHWITIVLDNTLEENIIEELIDQSYRLVS